jgi:2,5-diketo-D-gluconate reductase A
VALTAGYRHVDTATRYGNEREVGAAVRASGLQVFVTTKFRPELGDPPRVALERSLERLGLDAVDLWLVHRPPPAPVAVWHEFVRAQADGLARDIGVSNFGLDLVDEITRATDVPPAVNQIPWSPVRFDSATLREHRARGIVVEGYSGLRHGSLEHPVVRAVADRLGRTPAQVVIRWHLQHRVVVIPRSSNPGRIAGNADVAGFTISQGDMARLDALGAS